MNIATNPNRQPAKRVKPNPIDPRAHNYKVVDTDFHFIPGLASPAEVHAGAVSDRADQISAGRRRLHAAICDRIEGTGQETMGRASTAADVLKVMEEIGVETVVLSPGFQRPQSMFHPAMLAAVASAYNDFSPPRCCREPAHQGRDHDQPPRPAAGAAEIRRMAKHPGFVSVYTEFGGNLRADRHRQA
jgi:hypothetical protein